MCVETAQLLATAIHLNNGEATYKPTHIHHPVTKFVALNRSNYRWALRHFAALCREYTRTTGKIHKSSNYIKEFIKGAKSIPEGRLTPFTNCAGNKSFNISYNHVKNTNKAYRLYLRDRWKTDKIEPKWI